MKKSGLLVLSILCITCSVLAQDIEVPKKKLYNPADDAKAAIAKALTTAQKEGKHVLLQIGGNWCGWCIAFDKKVQSNDTLRLAMEQNFVVYHLNYSKEEKNKDILKSLDYPQRFGFPVFVVLDAKGNRIHTQNSAYLEEGKGHGTRKVLDFFQHWSPAALDGEKYEKW